MNAARRVPGVRAACVALIVLSSSIVPACTSPEARSDAPVETSPSAVTATADGAATPSAAVPPTAAPSGAGEPTRAEPPPAPPLPRLASGELPVYPRMSRRIGEEGWVEVVIDVREDGEVLGFAIAASSGSPRLDEAVLTAARTWRFLPRTGPRGVDHMRHRIVFQLTKK